MLPIDDLEAGYGYGGAAGLSTTGLCTYTLQSIVYEIAIRAGMDPRQVDVTQLAGINVRGFAITNLYAAYGAIQSLSSIFLFDPSNYDGQVHFLPRGRDAVATITEDDMILVNEDDLDNIEDQTQTADAIQIPRVLNLNYYDVDGGSATDKQTSERAGDFRATGDQSLQTSVIMNADEARRAVTVNHKLMVEDQKSQLKFTLTDKFLALTVADNVFIQYQGKTRRARLVQVDTNDGQQAYTSLQDRQSAYVSNIQGYPASIPTPPPNRLVGKTILEAIDIHLINDGDDYLGCYVAASGSVPAWVGAQIDVSLDGGATFIDSFTVTREATIGRTLTTMGDHPLDIPDNDSSVSIRFPLVDDELDSTNDAGLLNLANLAIIGNEVIQFRDATQDSNGDWHLSGFLRGRKGTDPVAHAVDERFILLDRSIINFIPAQLVYLNRAITLRAISLNGDSTDVTTITFNYTGQSQVEYCPQYLMAHRDGTNAVISWQGVGKLGAGVSVAMGLYFTGYRVSLTDGTSTINLDINNTVPDVMTTMVDVSSLAGPITVSISQRNSLTGLGPSTTLVF